MLHPLFTSNLQLPSFNGSNGDEIMIEGAPSSQVLSLSFFLFGMGFCLADVMADSLVAEKAKLEPLEHHGQLQTTCYACRFFGLMVAAPCRTLLYSNFENGPTIIVGLLGGIPLILMIPLVYFLRDDPPPQS
jgi:MFS family permease